jgi:hypothetical protein
MNFILIFILAQFAFTFIISITIIAKGNKPEYCYYKMFDGSETIHLSYIITGGYERDKCHVLLYDPKGQVIYQKYTTDKGDFTLEPMSFPNAGKYTLCFKLLDSAKIFINLEFYTLTETGVNQVKLAKDGIYI